ncbi:MAG: hypothetical protein ACRBBK_12725 [Paracoccaceae bacterium]
MTQAKADELWTFERFFPGQDFGAIDVNLDARRVAGWEAVYGPIEGRYAPDGLIVAGMMEAYLLAIQPRPNGNVHAAQKLAFTGVRAALGDTLTYRVEIAKAEQKKGRFWVTFSIQAAHADKELMQGELVSIWAA